MISLLLKFLGVDVGPGARVVDVEPLLRPGPGALAFWVLAAFLLVSAASVWLYRREATDVPPWRRHTMAALRACFLGLLLLLLLRPGLRITLEGDVRRQVVILLDGSQSMSIRDARTDPPDLARAALALGRLDPARGLDQPSAESPVTDPPRDQLVRSMLTGPRLALLERLSRDYDLRILSFGRETADLVGDPATTRPATTDASALRAIESLRAADRATALGDAVRDVVSRSRGQPVAGVFIATDGASNAGLSPRSAAESAGQSDMPLYLWGVGLTRPKDLAVSQLFAPEVAFLKDEVVLSVRLRTTGLERQTATLRLKLGDETVVTQPTLLGADGELTVQARFTPRTAGEFTLSAEVEPLPGEVVRDNNVRSAKLRIVDGKIKVLYVETSPRWEFKYLQAMLLRDRRVEPRFLLLDASPARTEGEPTDGPFLQRFPSTKEELFKFDLLILGDVDPRAFTADQLRWVEEHVSKFGAGLVMLAGRQRSPSLWTGTPVERVIPVEWEPPGSSSPAARRSDTGDAPTRLELTPAGRASTMLRLADTDAESAVLWARLPELYWTAPVVRARAGADVLVVDPDPARANRFGKRPVIAVQQYGVGTSMFVGTDNLWRWRRNLGDLHHARLWGQIVQRLALPHLLGESKRTQLTSDRRSYSVGDTAVLFARLYTPAFEPVTLPAVRGVLSLTTAASSEKVPVVLRPLPDQPGMYRGEAVIPRPGTWHFAVETDDQTHLEFAAAESSAELSETAMNEPLLRDMARVSGGAFLREEDLHTLPDLLARRAERVRSTAETELWSSPAYFTLLVLLLAAEWLLRKGALLK